jgi:hypothetical protein
MKKMLLLSLFAPFFAKAQFVIVNTSTTSIVEPRTGNWPLGLQRIIKESDTCYVLEFRDQQFSSSVNMSTLKFGNLGQLKYFQKGLIALKTGTNGDIARFKEYTIKRSDVKRDGVWYILTCNDGSLTNFQQSEADKMIAAIKPL